MTRQLVHSATELLDHRLREHGVVQIDYILNNVVAKGVLDQGDRVLSNVLDQGDLLVTGRVVDAALEDAAAVTVSANFDAVVTDSAEDELSVKGAELVETLLNDVVAVQVLNELNDAAIKSSNNDQHLVLVGQVLDHLLQSTSSVLIQSDANHILGRVLDKHRSLVVIAVLEELLAKVVTKRIGHELDNVSASLQPDHVNLLRNAILELLLQESTAVLVLAKLVDTATVGLKGLTAEAAHGCIIVSNRCR